MYAYMSGNAGVYKMCAACRRHLKRLRYKTGRYYLYSDLLSQNHKRQGEKVGKADGWCATPSGPRSSSQVHCCQGCHQ